MADSLSFHFNQNVISSNSSNGIVLSPPSPVLTALVSNAPFPSGQITLAQASLQAEDGKDITFGGDGKGNVSFSASASSSIVVNTDPAQVVTGLQLADPIGSGLSFPTDAASSWVALQWGYDLQGSAQGSVGLGGALTVTFGADGKNSGAFALLHRYAPNAPSRDVIGDLVASWRLPRQITAPGDLRPGTWLIAEIDGLLSLSLGVQYGYLFNWLRQVEGRLAGDIALRLQLGLKATLGFTASGRYAFVVSRPSTDPAQQVLRLQLFRQSKNGWSFAFDVAANVQANLGTVVPSTPEGLLRAVLNVHDGQILSDLQEWLDPNKDLGTMLADSGAAYVGNFLNQVTGIDVAAELNQARAKLSDFLQKWDTIDQRVASSLWAHIEESSYVTAVRGLAQQISNTLGNDQTLRTLLTQKIETVGFFNTPEGQWLGSQITDGLLSLIQNQLQQLRKVADQTLSIVNEQEVLSIAQKLKGYITQRFGLDQIKVALQNAVDASDPTKLDAWLRGRLTAFFDASPTVQQLSDVKNAINAILQKGQALYDKTLKALQRQYGADFAVTYQSTTSETALLDIELDFTKDDGSLGDLLKNAMAGDFNKLLTETHTGVILHTATLTHEIQREKHIDLTLPSSLQEMGSINHALASVTASDDGSRVLLYEASGSDEVSVATAKSRRDSRLSLVAQLSVPVIGLRRHEEESLTYSYSFHQATANLQTDDLKDQMGAYVQEYLPEHFMASNGAISKTFSTWVNDLDKEAEVLEQNGTGNLGNTLVTLELGVPPEIGKAWLQAPAKGNQVYLDMSIRLQEKLKELIPFFFFQDLNRYRNQANDALLAYAAIPSSNWVEFKDSDSSPVPDGSSRLHWDYPSYLPKMVLSPGADHNLQLMLSRIRGTLTHVPGFADVVERFKNLQYASSTIRNHALTQSLYVFLYNLVNVESQLVNAAAETGAQMAEFASQMVTKPEQAITALAQFAGKLAEVFNNNVWSTYGGSAIRPMGTLLFCEAARAIDPSLTPDTSALFRVAILKQSVTPFPPATFPDDSGVTANQVLIEHTIVST